MFFTDGWQPLAGLSLIYWQSYKKKLSDDTLPLKKKVKPEILCNFASIQTERAKMRDVLLHCCCAPCSSAIIEWMLANDVRPTLYYNNPNIYPEQEYLIRKNELTRYAAELGLRVIDDESSPLWQGWQKYHDCWLAGIRGMEDEPERGSRCLQCFKLRLLAAAETAVREGISEFTTTLASSRWKSLSQITEAGEWAAHQTGDRVAFDARNWRKGGLQQRRNELLREHGFYNQLYCGCEFSLRQTEEHRRKKAEEGVSE